jgi:hypothetical protein
MGEAGFLDELARRSAKGKIRYHAVACTTADDLEPCQSEVAGVQARLNLLEYDSAWPFLASARDKRLAMMGAQPMMPRLVLPRLQPPVDQLSSLLKRVT